MLLDDLPTLDDKLGWNSELSRMSSRIEKCPTPHVLGIHGNWGSGKTSFMRQIQANLGGKYEENGSVNPGAFTAKKNSRRTTITVWFDAWRYQNEASPIVALLQEMRRQMSLIPAVQKKFEKLGSIALRYTLEGLADIGKAIGLEVIPNAEKIQKIGEVWESDHYATTLNSDSIRTHLHSTIVSLLPGGEQSRVVVFIDDLDRCNPKAAFKLLEGLKIYLNLPNCVFVLGMNENILIDAIRDEICAPSDASRGEMYLRASHYLEKICTDIYRLPLPTNSSALFTKFLNRHQSSEHVAAFNLALGNLVCLPPNPRRLKALANQCSRFIGCLDYPDTQEQQVTWAAKVLICSYIYQFHRDLWERWHFDPDFWVECIAWCNGERSINQNGDDTSPNWASALKLTTRTYTGLASAYPAWSVQYPNPGDIDLFWIDALIREHRDDLSPRDFNELLEGKQVTTTKRGR